MDNGDNEIREFMRQSAPKILVIGTGGSGNNTINRMHDVGIAGATLVAVNTDAQHLLSIKAGKKLLIGKKTTEGLGAGSDPRLGEASAVEAEEDIRKMVNGASLVFITCGLGGGTGTGSAHVIARIAKEEGALSVGVVTLPFTSEGPKRAENALVGLQKLKKAADSTIAIPNDKLLFYVPNLPINNAFKAADEVLTNAVKGITELITKTGLVNLDFADLRTVLKESRMAMIGFGEAKGGDVKNVIEATERALTSPLLDMDISEAGKAIVNITGGEGLTLGEAEAAVSTVSSKISKDAHIIWGAITDKKMDNKIKVLVVLAGVKHRKEEEGEEIKLDFV